MTRLHVLHSDPRDLPNDFWESPACELMIMSRWAQERPHEVTWLKEKLPDIPHHVWIASSGTLAKHGESQWIALSKQALLTSAAAVNSHLQVKANEAWGLALPLAHVGGLGILARACLMNQKVIPLSLDHWDPSALSANQWSGQLLSLVPTQVHDLVKNKILPPSTLRAVVVGGDRLAPTQYAEALQLGWPLLPSYGLTECSSQVATARSGEHDGKMQLLPHIKATTDHEERLILLSDSLFSGKADILRGKILWSPREIGPWRTQDRAEIGKDGTLTLLGRFDSVVKIRGEKVDVQVLENELREITGRALVVIPMPDERDGHSLWVVSDTHVSLDVLNQNLLPHQRIRGIRQMESLPRTALGKIRRGEIRTWLLS